MRSSSFAAMGAAMALLLVSMVCSAIAAERKTFDQKSFDAAQASGARILVDISAPWCPTCAAKKPIVDSLAAGPANRDLIILAVDFDSQKAVVRQFCAQHQGTLIALRGKTETDRSVGDTDPKSIAACQLDSLAAIPLLVLGMASRELGPPEKPGRFNP